MEQQDEHNPLWWACCPPSGCSTLPGCTPPPRRHVQRLHGGTCPLGHLRVLAVPLVLAAHRPRAHHRGRPSDLQRGLRSLGRHHRRDLLPAQGLALHEQGAFTDIELLQTLAPVVLAALVIAQGFCCMAWSRSTTWACRRGVHLGSTRWSLLGIAAATAGSLVLLVGTILGCLGYVVFMFRVDVPMYPRWRRAGHRQTTCPSPRDSPTPDAVALPLLAVWQPDAGHRCWPPCGPASCWVVPRIRPLPGRGPGWSAHRRTAMTRPEQARGSAPPPAGCAHQP